MNSTRWPLGLLVLALLAGMLLITSAANNVMLADSGNPREIRISRGTPDSPTATPTRIKGQPHTAVSAYFRALMTKNTRRVTPLVCEAWREQANTQVVSFGGVIPSLSRLACKTTSREGDTAVVACTGKIIVNYNGIRRSLDLAARTYRAKAESGMWKMCGNVE